MIRRPPPPIRNPYYETTSWRVWRDDESPIEGVKSMVREGKQKKAVEVTVSAPSANARAYPVDGPELALKKSSKPSPRYAGIWDDVYTSWSGLHGYVRGRWRGDAGENLPVLDSIIHFVDVTKRDTTRVGVNFIHQSTTGMAHTITNGYSVPMTTNYEKLYFADALLTSPAHASFNDLEANRSTDLFMALCPTQFNSVGSSNSETMAITKMIIAGGYLPPATKLLLKRNGLYPAAMLYLWKSSLPYTVPYDHELRHRVAYKSVGNRETYPERYSAAGIHRGDMCLAFHRYDDGAHMRAMAARARSMTVAQPEALVKVLAVEGGTTRHTLRKSVLVVQEKGQTIRLRVSASDSYDLQDRPLTVRWKLLYGNRDTTVELEAGVYAITVPWNDALPEGRTALALIANNGTFDSNPAVISIYRKWGDLPGHGGGPGNYKYPGKRANRRPVILDVQNQAVRPGKTVSFAVSAIDPEGFPLRFHNRAGEVGEFDGDVFTWKCPSRAKPGPRVVTLIASDGTSGNSYAGKRITLHVKAKKKPPRIVADRLTGSAPLTVKVSAKVSGRTKVGWEFYAPSLKRKPAAFKKMEHGRAASHTFAKPGVYEIALTTQSAGETRSTTVGVLVTGERTRENRAPALRVEGNGVTIRNGDDSPNPFDHTDFAKADERTFLLFNRGDKPLTIKGGKAISITGEAAADFKVVRRPRTRLAARGSSRLVVRFRPTQKGRRRAELRIQAAGATYRFALAGQGN